MFSTGITERLKNRHRRFVLLHPPFVVPLDTECKRRCVFNNKCFDQTVVGYGFDLEPVGESIDSLRMQRINGDSLLAGDSFK